jgi:hypothetical protein
VSSVVEHLIAAVQLEAELEHLRQRVCPEDSARRPMYATAMLQPPSDFAPNTSLCMFTRYSPTLQQFAPVSNAVSAYFVFRRLRQIFHPGRYIPSLRAFFYRSGCISLFNTYAAVLQGADELGPCLIPKTFPSTAQPRWVYDQERRTVKHDFTPSSSQAREGFIAVRSGTQVVIQTSSYTPDDYVHVTVVEPATDVDIVGTRGRVPSLCMHRIKGCRRREGVWRVDYQGADASDASCSGGGFDTASAAAMRACSSGFLTTLMLRLSCDFRSAVRHRKRDVKMNRVILSRVAAQRYPRIIQVRISQAFLF